MKEQLFGTKVQGAHGACFGACFGHQGLQPSLQSAMAKRERLAIKTTELQGGIQVLPQLVSEMQEVLASPSPVPVKVRHRWKPWWKAKRIDYRGYFAYAVVRLNCSEGSASSSPQLCHRPRSNSNRITLSFGTMSLE